jgi:hypothetical protein
LLTTTSGESLGAKFISPYAFTSCSFSSGVH